MRPPPSPEQLARNKRMIIAAAAIIFGSNGNALRPMQSRSVDIRLEPYAVSSLVSREIVISDRAEIERVATQLRTAHGVSLNHPNAACG